MKITDIPKIGDKWIDKITSFEVIIYIVVGIVCIILWGIIK